MNSILLSQEHGVNPSVEQCFFCGKDVGVVLFGRLKGDREAPHRVCLGPNSEPCAECKKHMKIGVILISMDDSKTTDQQNPHRSGGWVVVREQYVRRAFPPDVAEDLCKNRVGFLVDEVWDRFGLPRGETKDAKEDRDSGRKRKRVGDGSSHRRRKPKG